MNERKWTKGPWEIIPRGSKHLAPCILRKAETCGAYVAEVRTYPPDPEADANARLIAAAPDLYEALEEANNVIRSLAVAYLMTIPDGDERGFFPLYDRMKSALAKARGEA